MTRVRFIKRNFDEVAILAVATKLAFEEKPEFDVSGQATIAAMQRAHPQAGATIEELGGWLSSMAPDQILGVVNNTKGVLHEMEFVRLENEDGDSVHAALFDETNHEGFDVTFIDVDTGEEWEAQLKATDSASYVENWIHAHPGGEIIVTDELADSMHLETSHLTNSDLTSRSQEVVDKLIAAGDGDTVWDYFPYMTASSLGLVVWGIWQRYRAGEISLSRFKWLIARATGLKAGKVAALSLAMSIPGLNVVTGAALATQLILRSFSLNQASFVHRPIGSLLRRSDA